MHCVWWRGLVVAPVWHSFKETKSKGTALAVYGRACWNKIKNKEEGRKKLTTTLSFLPNLPNGSLNLKGTFFSVESNDGSKWLLFLVHKKLSITGENGYNYNQIKAVESRCGWNDSALKSGRLQLHCVLCTWERICLYSIMWFQSYHLCAF